MRNRSLLILFIVILGWQGCTYDLLPVPVNCEKDGVVISNIATEDTECGQSVGQIEITATGGTSGVYQYQLDGGPLQLSPIFADLGVGSYIVTVIDKSCSASQQVVIGNKNGVNIQILSTTDAGCNTSNGAITIDGTGGVKPYSFKIDNGNYQETKTFSELKSGEYNLHVKDATGCEAWQKVHVTSGITFSGEIKSIIENNCAIDGCHNGGTISLPDFSQFNNVKVYSAEIKQKTSDRTMPKKGSLTQEEIDHIACWVDDGAIEN